MTKQRAKNTILVTGSSRGIGRAISLELARQGYGIVLHGRTSGDSLDKTAEDIRAVGAQVRQLTFDLIDRQCCEQAIEKDISDFGPYHGVVLNAGVARDGAFPFLSGKDWDDVLRVNLDGFYNVVHPALEPMLLAHTPGRIVVISSVAGLLGNRGQVNYSASKAGLIGAVRALGLELARRNITVNCIAPGIIDTDMSRETPSKLLQLIPMQRIGHPDEVAAAVAFLMSDRAAYITRQVIAVDGGLS